jgi:hypothetical protein
MTSIAVYGQFAANPKTKFSVRMPDFNSLPSRTTCLEYIKPYLSAFRLRRLFQFLGQPLSLEAFRRHKGAVEIILAPMDDRINVVITLSFWHSVRHPDF